MAQQPLRQFHMPTGSSRSGFAQPRASPRRPSSPKPRRQPFSPRLSRVERPFDFDALKVSTPSSTPAPKPSSSRTAPSSTTTPSSRARRGKQVRLSVVQDQGSSDPRDMWMMTAAASYGLAPGSSSPAPVYPAVPASTASARPRLVIQTHSTGSSSTSTDSSTSRSTVASSLASYDKPLPCPPAAQYHANPSYARRRQSRHSQHYHQQPVIIRTSSESFSVWSGLRAMWKKTTAHVRSAPTVFAPERDSVLWNGFMPVQPESEPAATPVPAVEDASSFAQPISRPGSRGSGNVRNSEWWRAREVAVVEASVRY